MLLAGLDDGDRVLGDRVAATHRVLAQRDVVVLRAGEVLQQVAVALRRHDAQVEAQPVVRDDRRLGRALGGDVDHPAKRAEVVDERLRVGRRRDDVEVAHRLAHAARRAGERDLDRRLMLLQHLHDRAQLRQRRTEQRTMRPFRGARARQRLGDLLLRAGPDPGVPAQLLRLRRRLQPVDGRDAELLPDPPRRLRTESGQAHERRDLRRHFRLPLRQRVDLTVFDDLDDLRLDRLADPLQRLGLPVERELRHGRRRLADPRGRLAVGVDAKEIGSFELHQVAEQLELLRELVVPRQFGHGGDHRRRHARHRLPADLQRTRESRRDAARAAGRSARGRPGARDRRQLPRRHRRDRRPARVPSCRSSPCCTASARRASARPTSPASAARSTRAPSSSWRWTATSRTIRQTSRD